MDSETKHRQEISGEDVVYSNISREDTYDVDIILPTLDEEINILVLLEMLECKKYHKIIIDDSKTNKTVENILEYNKKKPIPNLTVVEGDRKNLGGAYKKACKFLQSGKVIVMDTDLSHDPFDIRKFLWIAERSQDCSVVTGTRYKSKNVFFQQQRGSICKCCGEKDQELIFPVKETPSGSFVKGGVGWPFKRKFISSGANVLTSIFAGGDYDFTGSFRLYRRDFFEEIIENCPSNCFSFQMQALCYAIRKKKKIEECPIIFHDRVDGESKMGAMHYFKFIKSLMIVAVKSVL